MTIGKLNFNKEFFIKYKIVLMCILCTIFALLNPLWGGFIYFLYVGLFLFALFFTPQESLCVYAFLFFYTSLTMSQLGAYIIYSLVLLGITVRYIYDAIKKNEKVAKQPLVISLIFYVVSIIPFWNYAHFFGIAISLLFLVPIYLIYIYRNRLDAISINKHLFAGLVSSTVLGYLLGAICKFPHYWALINLSGRMQFFTDNPNFLSFACIMIIAGFINSILKKRINWWTGILYISITIFIGSQTKSKAFMLALFILIAFTILILIFKNKKMGFVALGIVSIVCISLFFCFKSYFQFMSERFLNNGMLSIESITTDRWELWMEFIRIQFSSPINIILGMGAWSEKFLSSNNFGSFGGGCHSLYIEFFYHYGLIGIVLLILLICAYFKTTEREIGKNKMFVKTEDIMPLAMVMILGIVEMVIFSQKAIFLPLALLYIFNGVKYVPVGSEKLNRVKFLHKHKRKR